jgi:hypothetical protein
MNIFENYYRAGKTSSYYHVPISMLEEFRKKFPGVYKIRYRGPRNTPQDANRGYMSRQSTCLKTNAVKFSAYPY